jgi:hypothetical protein
MWMIAHYSQEPCHCGEQETVEVTGPNLQARLCFRCIVGLMARAAGQDHGQGSASGNAAKPKRKAESRSRSRTTGHGVVMHTTGSDEFFAEDAASNGNGDPVSDQPPAAIPATPPTNYPRRGRGTPPHALPIASQRKEFPPFFGGAIMAKNGTTTTMTLDEAIGRLVEAYEGRLVGDVLVISQEWLDVIGQHVGEGVIADDD